MDEASDAPVTFGEYLDELERIASEHPEAQVIDERGNRVGITASEFVVQSQQGAADRAGKMYRLGDPPEACQLPRIERRDQEWVLVG